MCSEFTAAVQLLAAREMMNYLLKLPDDKDDGMFIVYQYITTYNL
jgi:hypothetical protein